MCINDEINDLIGCVNVETFAEPINCHLRRCHGIEHEILQILQVLVRKELCFVHAPIISTGSDGSRPLVCHLGNWSEAADQFVSLTHSWVVYSNSHSQLMSPTSYNVSSSNVANSSWRYSSKDIVVCERGWHKLENPMCILVAGKVRTIAYTNAVDLPSYHAHQHIGLVLVTLELVSHI